VPGLESRREVTSSDFYLGRSGFYAYDPIDMLNLERLFQRRDIDIHSAGDFHQEVDGPDSLSPSVRSAHTKQVINADNLHLAG
jgi:hypothetical protein